MKCKFTLCLPGIALRRLPPVPAIGQLTASDLGRLFAALIRWLSIDRKFAAIAIMVMPGIQTQAAPVVTRLRFTQPSHLLVATTFNKSGSLIAAGFWYSDSNDKAIVQSYDVPGNLVKNTAFGSSDEWIDYQGSDVAVDGSNNIIISGVNTDARRETGDFYDAFVAKFNPNGDVIWSREFGRRGVASGESVISDQAGDIYVAGQARNLMNPVPGASSTAYLRKYSSTGDELWTNQTVSSTYSSFKGTAIDQLGYIYATGLVRQAGSGFRYNSLLSKFDDVGNEIWSRELATDASDYAEDVTVDAHGNAYIAGITHGALAGEYLGASDAFLAKHNTDGDLLWSKQFGTTNTDGVTDIIADEFGDVFVAGYVNGTSSSNDATATIRKYNGDGDLIWSFTPTSLGNRVNSLSLNDVGNLIATNYSAIALIREGEPGDFDFDGSVTGADFLVWQRTVGSTMDLAADGDNSGIVDAGDLAIWQAHFGDAAASNEVTRVIPEPGGVLLLFLGVLFAPLVRRHSKSL